MSEIAKPPVQSQTPPGAGPSVPPPQLPTGWIAQWDPDTRRYYYVQPASGITTWDLPQSSASSTPHHTPAPVQNSLCNTPPCDQVYSPSSDPTQQQQQQQQPAHDQNPQQSPRGGPLGALSSLASGKGKNYGILPGLFHVASHGGGGSSGGRGSGGIGGFGDLLSKPGGLLSMIPGMANNNLKSNQAHGQPHGGNYSGQHHLSGQHNSQSQFLPLPYRTSSTGQPYPPQQQQQYPQQPYPPQQYPHPPQQHPHPPQPYPPQQPQQPQQYLPQQYSQQYLPQQYPQHYPPHGQQGNHQTAPPLAQQPNNYGGPQHPQQPPYGGAPTGTPSTQPYPHGA